MTLLTDSIVRRYMKGTSGFVLCDEGKLAPVTVSLADGEVMIGWYKNPTPWDGSSLVFTSHAIWSAEGDTKERIAFGDIVGYESPRTKGVSGLRVRTKDGFRFLRVAGAYGPSGKYKDFIGLMMVLRSVTKTLSVSE